MFVRYHPSQIALCHCVSVQHNCVQILLHCVCLACSLMCCTFLQIVFRDFPRPATRSRHDVSMAQGCLSTNNHCIWCVGTRIWVFIDFRSSQSTMFYAQKCYNNTIIDPFPQKVMPKGAHQISATIFSAGCYQNQNKKIIALFINFSVVKFVIEK